jgi:uncharacterized membrane protein YsdA (DUF1294 family)
MVFEFFKTYLMGINIVSFLTFGYDKFNSKFGRRRIPEKYLHMLTSSGGFLGSITGMSLFRHKTKKLNFILITMAITVLESTLLYSYLTKHNLLSS